MKQLKILLVWFFCIAAAVTHAQDSETPTPSATEAATVVPDGASASQSAEGRQEAARLAQPYLQGDLELLVGNVQRPNALVWLDGLLYTVCNGDWTIYQIDAQTGDTISFVFGVKNGNSMLAEGGAEVFEIWVPDPDSQTLWKVNQERQAPVAISDQIGTPWGITRLNEDSFLLTNTQDHAIVQVSESGETSTILTELRSPTGIAKDGDRIYYANGGSARRGIEWIELLEDGTWSQPLSLVSGLQNTSNILMGSDGLLYFAYALGTRGVVGRIEPSRCLEEGCGNADVEMVIFSDILAPVALAISPDLRLFLHSRFRPEIYWLQLPTDSREP